VTLISERRKKKEDEDQKKRIENDRGARLLELIERKARRRRGTSSPVPAA